MKKLLSHPHLSFMSMPFSVVIGLGMGRLVGHYPLYALIGILAWTYILIMLAKLNNKRLRKEMSE